MMPRETRFATVKATGSRYLVINVDFGSGKVFCWGEVEAVRGLGTRHAAQRVFVMDAVTLATVPKTQELVDSLFQQGFAAARASGRNVRIVGRGRR